MESEAVSNRPESPKKKLKSSNASDSEAQPSNYSKSADSNDGHQQNSLHINGMVVSGLAAPNRHGRLLSSTPDSSSERSHDESQENASPPRIQEEEVSSSENSVGKRKEIHESLSECDADSVSKESEDFTLICDSASSDSTSSDSNDKH